MDFVESEEFRLMANLLNFTIFFETKSPRYPKRPGVIIERDDAGRWDTWPVSRWDDAEEMETRNRTVKRPGLVWAR
jgi:hypothetical protein